jgi:hypothetical protein
VCVCVCVRQGGGGGRVCVYLPVYVRPSAHAYVCVREAR